MGCLSNVAGFEPVLGCVADTVDVNCIAVNCVQDAENVWPTAVQHFAEICSEV
jgi:hypothetical protein